MKWPLRNQILLRMLVLLLLSITAVTFANIRSTIASSRAAEEFRIRKIVELIQSTRFPLSDSVLENMSLLSGAEFLLQNRNGEPIAKTQLTPIIELNRSAGTCDPEASPRTFRYNDRVYYHQMIETSVDRNWQRTDDHLHIFLPRQSDFQIWSQASKSPLAIAVLTLPLAVAISWAMANQVTRPLVKLKDQVRQIGAGDLRQYPPIRGNDEIRQLGDSINELAIKLQNHDEQLRKNERLKNMVQFGNSIAHHLRNMSTGCKMAIELLADKHAEIGRSENFQVATRQLERINAYIKKFLLLSKTQGQLQSEYVEPLQLSSVLETTLFLLRPNAEHLDVQLLVDSDCDGSSVNMSREDAEQMMMNLVSNAISAAAEGNPDKHHQSGQVSVSLQVRQGQFSFSVVDNGNGPPEEIADSLFQPFTTGKTEGTGLGLAVVQDIAERTGGTINWQRHQRTTEFVFRSTSSDGQ